MKDPISVIMKYKVFASANIGDNGKWRGVISEAMTNISLLDTDFIYDSESMAIEAMNFEIVKLKEFAITIKDESMQEMREYSVDLFSKVNKTLLEVLSLDNLPERIRKDTQENLEGFGRLIDLISK